MTKQDLQHVVNLSGFYLKVHSAMLYGLITGPEVNAQKCEEWLEKGRNAGMYPDDNFIDPEFIGGPLPEVKK